MAGPVISTDVFMQAMHVCTGLFPIYERYCIIISSYYIFTAIDNNNFDTFLGILLLAIIMAVVATSLLSRASDAG